MNFRYFGDVVFIIWPEEIPILVKAVEKAKEVSKLKK